MKIELLAEINELEKIRKEWDYLAASDLRDGFFRTAAWIIPWFKHISSSAEPFVVTIRDSENTLLGLAPLCRTRFTDFGFKFKILTFAGREVVSGDFLDVIALPKHRLVVLNAVLDFIWEHRHSWDILQLGELFIDGNFHSVAVEWGNKKKLMLRRQELRICPYIELPLSFDDYLKDLSKSFRSLIRRRKRDIFIKNGCTIKVCEGADEIKEGLSLLTQLHAARWKKVNQPGNLNRPGFQKFFNEICTEPSNGYQCKLYILKHNKNAVGALIAFHFGDSALYYQAGWDPDSPISCLSPGVVLMAHAIEDSISNQLRYYEFLRGDESFKLHWTKKYRNVITLLFGKSFLAKGYLFILRFKDLAKHTIERTIGAKGHGSNIDKN